MFTTLISKFSGQCRRCHEAFPAGTRIRYAGPGRTYHFKAECPAAVLSGDATNLRYEAMDELESGAAAVRHAAIAARDFQGRRGRIL